MSKDNTQEFPATLILFEKDGMTYGKLRVDLPQPYPFKAVEFDVENTRFGVELLNMRKEKRDE